MDNAYKEVDSYTKNYKSLKRGNDLYKNEIENLQINNDELYDKNNELNNQINRILKAIKKFFRKLLQLGSEIIKEAQQAE